jgi:uncharacterized membrane protein
LVHDEDQVERLITQLEKRGIRPSLIVVDTLARCFVGGDENSSQEMGAFVAGVERLLRETGATVMIVHHSGKVVERGERGSTSLRGATDVMIKVTAREGIVTVANDKQKDDEQFEDIDFKLTQVEIVASSRTVTSCVLVAADDSEHSAASSVADHLSATLRVICEAEGGTIDAAEWREKLKLPETTFYKHCRDLQKDGYVQKLRKGRYGATPKAKALLANGNPVDPKTATA